MINELPSELSNESIVGLVTQQTENCAILFGAGISLNPPASVPIGWMISSALIENTTISLSKKLKDKMLNPSIDDLLSGQHIRFEFLCEAIERTTGSLEFLNFLDCYTHSNDNHENLATLLQNGSVLLTTNFDNLVERSKNFVSQNFKSINFPSYSGADVIGPALYKLHGSVPINCGGKLGATIANLRAPVFQNHLVQLFNRILKGRILIVTGYSGYDDFDISPALTQIEDCELLIWVNHDPKYSGNFSVNKLSEQISGEADKSEILLERIAALAPCLRGKILIVTGDTGHFLREISGNTTPVSKLRSVSNEEFEFDFQKSIAEEFANSDLNSKLYVTLKLLSQLGEYEEMKRVFSKTICSEDYSGLISTEPTIINSALSLFSLAKLFTDDAVEVANYFSNQSDAWNKSKDSENVCRFLINYAVALKNCGNDIEAAKIISEAKSVSKKIGEKELYLTALYNEAMFLGVNKISTDLLNEMRQLASQTNNYEMISKLHHILYHNTDLYEHLAKAIEYAVLDGKISSLADLVVLSSILDVRHYHRLLNSIERYAEGAGKDGHPWDTNKRIAFLAAYAYKMREIDRDEKKCLDLLFSALELAVGSDSVFDVAIAISVILVEDVSDSSPALYRKRAKEFSKIFEKVNLFWWRRNSPSQYLSFAVSWAIILYHAEYHTRSINFFKKLQGARTLRVLPNWLEEKSSYYYEIKRYEEALESAKKALIKTENVGNRLTIISRIGNIYFNLDRKVDAIDTYIELIKKSEVFSPNDLGSPLYNLARLFFRDNHILISAKLLALSEQFSTHDQPHIAARLLADLTNELGESLMMDYIHIARSVAKNRSSLKEHINVIIEEMRHIYRF